MRIICPVPTRGYIVRIGTRLNARLNAKRSKLDIREFKLTDSDQVIALWTECELTRPWNDPLRDIQRKMQVADSLFLVGEQDSTIVASVMGGYDGHRGWMNYLAVSPGCQRNGIASQLINELESRLLDAGCPKLNLQIRIDNLAVREFYATLGYSTDAVVSMGKRLIPD